MNFVSYFKSLPIQLIASILLAFLLGSYLDLSVVLFFYTLSSCFVEVLLFFLPFLVFSFIFSAAATAQKQSISLIIFIFCAIFASNATALYLSYFYSLLVLPLLGIDYSPELFENFTSFIKPIFRLNLPQLLTTDKAMLAAVVAGVGISFFSKENRFKRALLLGISFFSKLTAFFLYRIFIPFMPLYVFGFCLKLSYEQQLVHLFHAYGKVFLCSLFLVVCYLFLLYFLGAGGSLKLTLNRLKSMAPAGLTGFSTMSSAATMPVTLQCTHEITQDRQLTDLVIPTSSNIHMLGDDLTIVMAAMALMTMFGMPIPDFIPFSLFVAAFCVAKLSCVGIPGASVLVILPVLQTHLGFTPEMVTVLTTLYILQDSFGTCANVMGNGAFTALIQRLSQLRWRDTVSAKIDEIPSE